jgi:hypothetical protein
MSYLGAHTIPHQLRHPMSNPHKTPEDRISAFDARIAWLEQRAMPAALALLVIDLITYGIVNLAYL